MSRIEKKDYVVRSTNQKTVATEINATYPELKPQAEVLRSSFLTEDFDRYADFMHPVALQAVGGREEFINGLSESRSQLRMNGVEFLSYKIADAIQSLEMEGKIFVVLPYETKMRNSERTTTEEGNLLAVSDSDGRDWKFIRATSKERLRFLFPNVVDLLNFSESRMK